MCWLWGGGGGGTKRLCARVSFAVSGVQGTEVAGSRVLRQRTHAVLRAQSQP